MNWRVPATTLAIGMALLAAPAGAAAATTCELASGVLDVTMSASNDSAELGVGSGKIGVFGADGGLVACAGAAPTVTNTNAIAIHSLPGLFDTDVTLNQPNEFAPGLIAEPGDDELEIFVNLNNADSSELRINTPAAGGFLVFGTGGINPNATKAEDQRDADIILTMAPALVVNGSSGKDFVSAQGGYSTGGPLTDGITLFGAGGDDNLGGGAGNDVIAGDTGRDDLKGYGGDDVLVGGGSPTVLSGGSGDDRLLAGTINDLMLGEDGTDEADYSALSAGVTVDIGGDGFGLENAVGTNFGDVLRGDAGSNVIVGLKGDDLLEGGGGIDKLDGREGDDSLAVRDGGPDTADCGLDTDTVSTDGPGIDTLTGCENVLLRALDAGTGPGGGADVTPARLSGYRLSPTRFAAASKGPSVAAARRTRVGTTVRYTLSGPATLRFGVEHARSGRRVNGKCRAVTRRNRGRKRCTRYRALKGSFRTAGRLGRNSFKFTGRLRGRKVRPGRYRLVASATDVAGNRSKPKRAGFRVVSR